jgi:Transposase
MELLHCRCAGLDVHRDSVVACVRVAHAGGADQHVETFGTTTGELERLASWLTGHGVTHAALEATGVYWKPVWAVLAEELDLVLANAAQVKNVPGRKTDVNDAMWLADLLAHGLIRASFVPPLAVRRCATSRAPANSWSGRWPATSSASTSSCRRPTSSSARCARTSWARAAGPSSTRSPRARAIPRPWSARCAPGSAPRGPSKRVAEPFRRPRPIPCGELLSEAKG